MKHKSYHLKEITNPSRMYFYSKFINILIGILTVLIGITIYIIAENIFYKYIHSGFDVTPLKTTVLHICAGICAIPFITCGANIFIKVYKINKIMTHGKCYNGNIVSFSMYGVYKGTEISRNHKKNIILNIEYIKKKPHYCKASGYIHMPDKILSGKCCKVYLYDNMYFVTGFAIRKKNEPKILIPRER
ncbi:MAG: hypothetical protein IJ416_09750 [Ruminiclostridium sp.]|nr:hypothetical protein [Ruminiclostridium sp.]